MLAPHKTKTFISFQGLSGNWPHFFILFPFIVSACVTRAYLFHSPRPVQVARASSYGDGDEIPTYRAVRLGVFFLPRWRVYHQNAGGRAGDRLNRRSRFSLSPAHKSAGESPNLCNFLLQSLDFGFCLFSWFWLHKFWFSSIGSSDCNWLDVNVSVRSSFF